MSTARALEGQQDYDERLRTDADDMARLTARKEDGLAFVFGSGFGAIVALQVLIRHAASVRPLLAHEPTALSLLPDRTSGRSCMKRMTSTVPRGCRRRWASSSWA